QPLCYVYGTIMIYADFSDDVRRLTVADQPLADLHESRAQDFLTQIGHDAQRSRSVTIFVLLTCLGLYERPSSASRATYCARRTSPICHAPAKRVPCKNASIYAARAQHVVTRNRRTIDAHVTRPKRDLRGSPLSTELAKPGLAETTR